MEICRRGRRQCHNGPINQFVLDEGELITIGADGYVRVSTKYVFRTSLGLFLKNVILTSSPSSMFLCKGLGL